MRHDRIIAAAATARTQPCIFVCTCCEVTEHTDSPDAPRGWAIEYIDGTGYPFCPDCKIDLPGEHFPAGATATRLGVSSQLDADELLDWDEEDRRQARMLADLATAERIGARVMPIVLGAIAIGLALATLSQGAKWITMA